MTLLRESLFEGENFSIGAPMLSCAKNVYM